MKIVKLKKKTNDSFMTNHDLLEFVRNRSIVLSREDSSQLRPNKSKVALIPKKSYERLHTQQQENNPLISNTQGNSFVQTVADKAIILLQDCLTLMGETNPKWQHKIKKALGYVRQMQQEKQRELEDRKLQQKKSQRHVLNKIQTAHHQKLLMKKQIDQLKIKVSQYREQLSLFKKQSKLFSIGSKSTEMQSPSALQQLVINQSQVIDRQCQENLYQNEQLRQIIRLQALKIEQQLKCQNSKSNCSNLTNYYSIVSPFTLRK